MSSLVGIVQQYFRGNQTTLLPHQYEAYDGRWITVPRNAMIYGQQLKGGVDSGMYTRPSALLRVRQSRAQEFVPTWAGNQLQNTGWVQWQQVQQAVAAQTSPTLANLQNQLAVAQATQYNTGVIGG